MALSNTDREEIGNTIRIVVNGNIKRVEDKLDIHISRHDEMFENYKELTLKLEPVVEAVQWINTTKRFVLWVAGFAAAIGAILAIQKQL